VGKSKKGKRGKIYLKRETGSKGTWKEKFTGKRNLKKEGFPNNWTK